MEVTVTSSVQNGVMTYQLAANYTDEDLKKIFSCESTDDPLFKAVFLRCGKLDSEKLKVAVRVTEAIEVADQAASLELESESPIPK
jgi:hypothetical protein